MPQTIKDYFLSTLIGGTGLYALPNGYFWFCLISVLFSIIFFYWADLEKTIKYYKEMGVM